MTSALLIHHRLCQGASEVVDPELSRVPHHITHSDTEGETY